uniref:Prostaglandin E2 receptor EP2 subtype n=2 Tax=Latimeria chalumnae TaxID=7897 RepID=M3XHW7_LATCH
MFSAGVLGNLIALVLLERRRRERHRGVSLFHVLVTGLVLTDLLGTCLVSPVVLTSYAQNRSLLAMSEGGRMCSYFAFVMSFLGLASMLLLFAMALERYLAIGHPYFYGRRIGKRCSLVTFPLIYIFCTVFCLLPAIKQGYYVQYCPGTWCFINMKKSVYSSMYAMSMLVLLVSILICNFFVIAHLLQMHRRQRTRNGSSFGQERSKRIIMSEEVDHLILLILMTIIFVICSAPFTIRACIGTFSPDEKYKADLLALRFLSFNPIIDPWVFTIF